MSRLLVLLAITLLSAIHVSAQTAASSVTATTAPRTTTSAGGNSTNTRPRSSAATAGAAPDVYLNVPELHVGRIELTVEKLSADINLNAQVANLVKLNAGVQVNIEKVNITIAEVDAEVELVVRLGECHNMYKSMKSKAHTNPPRRSPRRYCQPRFRIARPQPATYQHYQQRHWPHQRSRRRCRRCCRRSPRLNHSGRLDSELPRRQLGQHRPGSRRSQHHCRRLHQEHDRDWRH
jgi:hypothetical protein